MGSALKSKAAIQPYLLPAILVCLSIFSACGSGSFGPGLSSSQALQLVSITVTPADPALLLGTLQQFTATGMFTDKSVKDITGSVTWSSSSSSVASIAAGGVATAAGLGAVTVSATSGSVTGSTNVNVQSAVLTSITVLPANGKIAPLTSQQFQAIGTYSDGSTHSVTPRVTWASSNPAAATTGNAGLATALATGTTTITATLGSISGSTSLDVTNATIVSVSVTPTGRTIATGTKLAFAATGSFSDGTTQVITRDSAWASDNLAVATLGGGSTATAVGPGAANISATFGGVTGSTPLQVSTATLTSVSVTPANAVLAPGTFVNCVATGTFSDGSTQVITGFVTWISSAPGVASVGAFGKVTAQAGGSASITAQLGSISGNSMVVVDSSPLTSIQISPPMATVGQQAQITFKAVGTFADGNMQDLTTSALWTSSPASVATISMGRATGVTPGTASIVALFGGQAGTASLTVSGGKSAALQTPAGGTNLNNPASSSSQRPPIL